LHALQGHSSAEIVTPARPDKGKRVSWQDESPPSRSTEDSAMIPGPKLQWVRETSRRKKLRMSSNSPPQTGSSTLLAGADVNLHRDTSSEDSGPAVPGSHFSALHGQDSGPTAPQSYFSMPHQQDSGPAVPNSHFSGSHQRDSGPIVPKSSFTSLHGQDSGPAVPQSHFSAPHQQADWALQDTDYGTPVPKSSFYHE